MKIILIDKSKNFSMENLFDLENTASPLGEFIGQCEKNGEKAVYFNRQQEDLKTVLDKILHDNFQASIDSIVIYLPNIKEQETIELISKNNKKVFVYLRSTILEMGQSAQYYWESESRLIKSIEKINSRKIISDFTKRSRAWNSLKDNAILFKIRANSAFEAMKNIPNIKQELILDLNIFVDQLGHHMASIRENYAKKLWINPEFQYPFSETRGLFYYRSDDFSPSLLLFSDYINTFKEKYPHINSEQFIPIDRNFDNLNEILGHNRFEVIIDGNTSDSTSNHFLLVFNSKKDCKNGLDKIIHLGLQPTPFKIRTRVWNNCYQPNIPLIEEISLPLNVNINTLDDLFSSIHYKKFSKLINVKSQEWDYMSIYAQSIISMLSGLDEWIKKNPISSDQAVLLKPSYQFIEIYIGWAVDNYKDHRRAANLFEWMMEEILFNLMILHPYQLNSFSNIMHDAILDPYYPDLMQESEENKLVNVFGFFNSGTRSFYEALTACYKIRPDAKLVYLSNSYFEVPQGVWKKDAVKEDYSEKNLQDYNADIYLANLAASLSADEKDSYFVDPDELVNKIFSQRTTKNPVNLFLDITISDLSEEIISIFLKKNQCRIEKGELNVIFIASLQKYGMLGTDKVQAGYVWAVNNPKLFNDFNTHITNQNFQNHFQDYQYICHIFKYAYTAIKRAYGINTRNAELLRKIDKGLRVKHADKSPFSFDQYNVEDKEKRENPFVKMKYFLTRSSFGFPYSTCVVIQNFDKKKLVTRVTPGHEGVTKMEILANISTLERTDPTKNNKEIINDIAKIIEIPLTQEKTKSFVHILQEFNSYLQQDSYTDTIKTYVTKITPLLLFLLNYAKSSDDNKKSKDEIFDEKLTLFNTFNLMIRKHALTLPSEFKSTFMIAIRLFKKELLYSITSSASDVPTEFFQLEYSPISFKRAEIINVTVDTFNLVVLRDLIEEQIRLGNGTYMDESSKHIFETIKNFLLTNKQTHYTNFVMRLQLLKKVSAYMMRDKTIRQDYHNRQQSYFNIIGISKHPFHKHQHVDRNRIIAFDSLENNKKTHFVDVFFDSLNEAEEFAKKHGLKMSIDIERKFSKDPVTKNIYKQKGLVRMDAKIYAELIFQEMSQKVRLFPHHDHFNMILNSSAIQHEFFARLPLVKPFNNEKSNEAYLNLFFDDFQSTNKFKEALGDKYRFNLQYEQQYNDRIDDPINALMFTRPVISISTGEFLLHLIKGSLADLQFEKLKNDLIICYQERKFLNSDLDILYALGKAGFNFFQELRRGDSGENKLNPPWNVALEENNISQLTVMLLTMKKLDNFPSYIDIKQLVSALVDELNRSHFSTEEKLTLIEDTLNGKNALGLIIKAKNNSSGRLFENKEASDRQLIEYKFTLESNRMQPNCDYPLRVAPSIDIPRVF